LVLVLMGCRRRMHRRQREASATPEFDRTLGLRSNCERSAACRASGQGVNV
jgi:hypothetical protein